MDEIVRAAMNKWPNVPDCHGWLGLDTAGRWRVGAWPGEPIAHSGLNAFIARNYLRLEDGRYCFQNGPQRVFVQLACTPWVLRLTDDHSLALHTHCGDALPAVQQWLTDELGRVFAAFQGDGGVTVGLLASADMQAFVTRAESAGLLSTLKPVQSADLPGLYGFNPLP
jgi:hypothetical protein